MFAMCYILFVVYLLIVRLFSFSFTEIIIVRVLKIFVPSFQNLSIYYLKNVFKKYRENIGKCDLVLKILS